MLISPGTGLIPLAHIPLAQPKGQTPARCLSPARVWLWPPGTLWIPPAAPSSPVDALRPVFPRWTGLPAAPALVAGAAAAVAAEGAAGAVHAVAAPLARRPPKPSLALALARLLGTGREAAGAFEAAPPAPPARQTVAVAGERVAAGAGEVALTLLLAGGCPPARLAAAGTGEGVAAAVGAALAGELAELSPVAGAAGAAPAGRVTAPIGVAQAAPLAVGTPVLLGAACEGREAVRMGGDGGSLAAPPSEHPDWQRGWRGQSSGKTLTGTAVCSEEAGFAEANPRSHAHLVWPAGILPLAQRCGQRVRHGSAQRLPRARTPPPDHLPRRPSQGNRHPAPRAIPPAKLQRCQQLPWWDWGVLTVQHPTATTKEGCRASPQHLALRRSRMAKCRDRALRLHHCPSLTGRALPPVLLPAGAAGRAGGEPAGESRAPSAGQAQLHTPSAKAKRRWALAPLWGRRAVRQRGPRDIAPEGNQQNRRKFKRLHRVVGQSYRVCAESPTHWERLKALPE